MVPALRQGEDKLLSSLRVLAQKVFFVSVNSWQFYFVCFYLHILAALQARQNQSRPCLLSTQPCWLTSFVNPRVMLWLCAAEIRLCSPHNEGKTAHYIQVIGNRDAATNSLKQTCFCSTDATVF